MFKIINIYWRSRWERFYLKNRWHLIFDLSLLTILVILGVSVISLYFYRPAANLLPGQELKPIVDLNNPPLKLDLTVDQPSLKISTGLVLKVKYKNNGSQAINQAKLDLSVVGENYSLLNLEKISTSSEIEVREQEIILPRLPSGLSGEALIKVNFKVNNSDDRSLNWQAKSEYLFGGQIFTSTWDLPSLSVISELMVNSAAYYTSPQGDQLGAGPLPPVVGLPTNYWLFIEAQSRGDLKDFVFSARLPKGVELMANRSLLAGDFKYSTTSRQIIWKVPEINNQESNYRLGFEVQLIPSLEQIGKIPNLLNNLTYFAQDANSGVEVNGELDNLNANLDADRFNKGQGRVSD